MREEEPEDEPDSMPQADQSGVAQRKWRNEIMEGS